MLRLVPVGSIVVVALTTWLSSAGGPPVPGIGRLFLGATGHGAEQTPSIGQGAARAPRGETRDPVSRLNDDLVDGRRTLAFAEPRGYLDAVLSALDVPSASQVLVFSKTSLQRDVISQQSPRAIYFNDSVSVAWVPDGNALELATVNRSEGVAFYTLTQSPTDPPRFVRGEKCAQCHLLPDSGGTLGLLMMSVPPNQPRAAGQPATGWPVDQTTPIPDRWGGWFVTGQRLPPQHLGTTQLGRVGPPAYLSASSDVTALLVLTHQVHVTNAAVRLSRELQRESATFSPRAAQLADRLADALVFADAAPLPSAVTGSRTFARAFERREHWIAGDRSLRELDLAQGRVFRYPLSYWVRSEGFAMLPAGARAEVLRRVRTRLTVPASDDRSGMDAEAVLRRRVAREILDQVERDFEAQ